METNPAQPKAEIQKNVAGLAKVQRLIPFSDLALIGEYAERFGKDPDLEVFPFISFGTVIAFATYWKEKAEFNERFSYIWKETQTKT